MSIPNARGSLIPVHVQINNSSLRGRTDGRNGFRAAGMGNRVQA